MTTTCKTNDPLLGHEAEPQGHLRTVILFGAICVHLALGLAVIRQNPAFWLDEYMGLAVVTGDWNDAARFFRSMPEQHPFHYLLLWIWVQAGDSEAWLRAQSLLLSAGTIPIISALAHRYLRGSWAPHGAVWMFALSPFVLTFATEARMYSLLLLLSAATLLLLLRALDSRRTMDWIAFTISAALCAWTHFFGVLLVLSLGLASLWAFRKEVAVFRPLLLTHFTVALLFLPWLFLILGGGVAEGQGWKGAAHAFLSLPYTALRFALGYGVLPVHFGWQEQVTDSVRDALPLIATGAAGFGLATLLLFLPLHSGSRAVPRVPSVPQGYLVPAALVGPMLLTFLLAPLVILAGDRYFVVSFPAFVAIIWFGVERATQSARSPIRAGGWCAALLVLAATAGATGNQILQEQSVGTEWNEVSDLLHRTGSPDLEILVYPGHIEGIARHYLGKRQGVGEVSVRSLQSWSVPHDFEGAWLLLSHTPESPDEALVAQSISMTVTHCKTFPRGAGIRVYRLAPAGHISPLACPPSSTEGSASVTLEPHLTGREVPNLPRCPSRSPAPRRSAGPSPPRKCARDTLRAPPRTPTGHHRGRGLERPAS
jgi:hypothetical protein